MLSPERYLRNVISGISSFSRSLSFVGLLVIFFSMVSYQDLNAEDDPFLPPCNTPCNGEWSAPDFLYIHTVHPLMPGCSLTINYRRRVCGDKIELYVWGWSYINGGTGCDLLKRSYHPSDAAYEAFLKQFMLTNIELVANHEFNLFWNGGQRIPPQGECPNNWISFESVLAACSKVAVYGNPITGTVERVVQERCPNGCCKYQISICRNMQTGQNEMTKSFVGGTPTCSSISLPPDPNRIYEQTECTPTCQ